MEPEPNCQALQTELSMMGTIQKI